MRKRINHLLAPVLILLSIAAPLHAAPLQQASSTEPGIPFQQDGDDWSLPLSAYGYGQTLQLSGQTASRDLFLVMPAGLMPQALETDVVVSPAVTRATVEVWSGAQLLAAREVRGGGERITIPLAGAALSDETLNVRVETRVEPTDEACVAPLASAWVALQNPTLIMRGEPTPPTSVAGFLPPVLSRATLFVPEAPTEAEAEAALTVAAGLAARYAGQPLEISVERMVDRDRLPAGNGYAVDERAFLVREGGSNSVRLEDAGGQPMLVIEGAGEALGEQARLVGSPLAAVAASGEVNVLEITRPEQISGEQVTLAELGYERAQVSGVGQLEVPFAISQSALGGPARMTGIRLAGNYTPVAESANATLSLLLNDTLIEAVHLNNTGHFDVYATLPEGQSARDNTLTARFDYNPTQGNCSLGITPFTASIDAGSYIQVERGQNLPPGFTRFPQSLLPSFVVAFETLDADALRAAADLVTALQRASSAPLTPEVTAWEEALSVEAPALLIAAESTSADSLNPPLGGAPLRMTAADSTTLLALEAEASFSALQAFEREGRDLLLLTTTGDARANDMTARLLDHPAGWYALNGDVLIAPNGMEPRTLTLRDGNPEATPLPPSVNVWWSQLQPFVFVVALIAVLVILALAYPRVVRRTPGA